ncbi:MAG: toll/interleukin-1 receptor domain-containing protein [Christensenellaceae bacterium]|nr:toll/interleukin-1 receptor domain-containing protein [Christensenellaceae bacterium]
MKCSFSPYEGTGKYIFVSYSHKDGEVIRPILEKLHAAGFRIWYDDGIEWGTEWPESIAMHLRNCEICMAFHSKTSSVSLNCRQEIHYALKQNRTVLSVYLEDVELSDGMDMRLSSHQSASPYQYGEEDKQLFYSRLIATKILQGCRDGIVSYDCSDSFEEESIDDYDCSDSFEDENIDDIEYDKFGFVGSSPIVRDNG